MKYKLKYIVVFNLALLTCASFGHYVQVHQAITINAEISADEDSPAYESVLSIVSPDISLFNVTKYMVLGSAREDDRVTAYAQKDAGCYRSLNHFYDPLDASYGKGLSDGVFSDSGSTGDKRELLGTNSFTRASISNCTGIGSSYYPHLWSNSHPTNTWSWQNARCFEWRGLAATNQMKSTI